MKDIIDTSFDYWYDMIKKNREERKRKDKLKKFFMSSGDEENIKPVQNEKKNSCLI